MENCSENIIPEKKRKCFCPITFRQEIKENDALKSLKKFITASHGSEDVILQYFQSGGSISEILSLIDTTAKGDLTTALPVLEIVLLIFLRFQAVDSEYHKQCIEGAKNILQSHILAVQTMLSMNTAKHRKVALKLLTTIIALHPSFANEVINTILPSSMLVTNLIQPSPEKESVRKHFILFVLSFLLEGNPVILKNLISNKGFLTSIFPGLKFDDVDTVNMVLSLVKDKILKNPKISKTLKLKLFNTQAIKSLFDLYEWKGLQGIKELTATKRKTKIVEIDEKEKNLVEEQVHSFLILLCTSTKYGVAFQDKSLGITDTLNNQLLFSVIETLSNPLSHKKMTEVLLKILVSCPDLLKPTLIKLEPFFQPRNSKNWFEAVEFAKNLIKELNAFDKLKSDGEQRSANYTLKVVKSLCAPLVLLKTANLGFDRNQTFNTRIASLELLTTMWNEIIKFKKEFSKDQSTFRKGINGYLAKFVPELEELVNLWYNLCDKEYIQNNSVSLENLPSYLCVVIEVLQMSIDCQIEKISSLLILVNDLLSHFDQLKDIFQENEILNNVEVKIIHFVENDLSSLTPDKELFKKSLQILLRNEDEVSVSCVSRILSSFNIFKRSKSEIDVWLQCFINLPNEYRPDVANFVIDSISKQFSNNSLDFETKNLDEKEEDDDELLNPVIHYCIENFINYASDSSEIPENMTSYQHFLKDLLIHLQHYYPENEFFKYVKPLKNLLGKPFLDHFRDWKNNNLKSENLEVIYYCSVEKNLISWILNDEDNGKIEEILNQNLDFLKLNQLFQTLVAYLVKKTMLNKLSEIDILKFSGSLSYFFETNVSFEDCTEFVVSQNLKNISVFINECIRCIFSNKTLLESFNVFNKKSANNCSEIIVKVLMSNENIRKKGAANSLIEAWKSKFLRQLKVKLKKKKSIESVDNLEIILSFFHFQQNEIAEVIEELVNVLDLTLFYHNNSPSKWALVLVKFIELHCLKDELNEKIIKKLCDLMKYLNDLDCDNLEILESCFVCLLETHPHHLTLIENEFLDVILNKEPSSDTILIGKLLLNDPTKIRYFLSILSNNMESDLILPLLSTLIVENDEFLEAIKSEQVCLVWKSSEISENSSIDLFEKLKIVYQRYEEKISRTLIGEQEDSILNNLSIIKTLIKLFIEKNVIKVNKKKFFKEGFQPELLFEAIKKLNLAELNKTLINEMLKWFCKLINESNNFEESFWFKYCSLLSEMIEFNKASGIIKRSSEWEEFFKLAVGLCFSRSKYPSLMKIIRYLISAQEAEDTESASFYFQMIISHSQFLNIIFGRSDLKNELIYLLEVLVKRCKSEMSVKHIPILLASYTCSMNNADRTLLNILKFYEINGCSLAEYEPLVWGESAISHYSIGTQSKLFLWQRFSMMNVLDLLDFHRMEISLVEFPIYRSLEEDPNFSISDLNSDIYDPAFLLPLFVNLLSPGSVVYPLPFIYKGALAFTVRALSSESFEMRSIASLVLTRFYNHLELTQNLKQKMVWMHFINGFRYGIKDLSAEPLPNIVTLFFAKLTLEMSQNAFDMYLPLQRFLLAKPYFSFVSIPEFLPLFHSSEVNHKKQRLWLLNILKNGTKTNQDLSIIYYSMAIKIIFCFFQSQLCDNETKKLILQALEKFLAAKKAELLITQYGLLNWIKSIDSNSYSVILSDLVKLLFTVSNVVIPGFKKKENKFANLEFIIQILNISMQLLPTFQSVKSTETFLIFLKIIYNCFILFVEKESIDWFEFNKTKLQQLIVYGTDILNLEYDYSKYCKLPFYFRDFKHETDSEVLLYYKRVLFLFNFLITRCEKMN